MLCVVVPCNPHLKHIYKPVPGMVSGDVCLCLLVGFLVSFGHAFGGVSYLWWDEVLDGL